MIARDCERERAQLAEALSPLMGTLDYYIGPNARTSVGQESVRSFERLRLALRRAQGLPCQGCEDSGRAKLWPADDPHPCLLRGLIEHGDVPLPEDVIARMIEHRDADREEDARPHEEGSREGTRIGPPRYEAELAEMGRG